MEAFAIYDVMMYVKPPIRTMCVGTAFGEAAMLLAAGTAGMRGALPSATLMLRQPINRYERMQASDIDIYRNELRCAAHAARSRETRAKYRLSAAPRWGTLSATVQPRSEQTLHCAKHTSSSPQLTPSSLQKEASVAWCSSASHSPSLHTVHDRSPAILPRWC